MKFLHAILGKEMLDVLVVPKIDINALFVFKNALILEEIRSKNTSNTSIV